MGKKEKSLIREVIEEADKNLGNIKTILKITNYSDNVKLLWKVKPFFYDRARLFWFWNAEEFKWEMVDETDVLVTIDDLLKFGGQLTTGGVKNNYLEAFKQVGRKNIPEDAPKHWVQFRNKIFDYTTGQTFEATPKYFSCNPIPWDIGESDETPVMDKLIKEWVGSDYLETIYEIMAYCCVPDYPIHLMFCMVGCGRNGKSQLQKVIQNFIGSHNICSTELDLLIDNRFESAKLYKKLICTLGETNFGVMTKTSLLKKLSGGDLIGYEFKNKTPFDSINYAKIIINSNSLPSSLDTSDGFYRRWFIIDFPNEFPEGKDIINSIPDQEYNNLARKVLKIIPHLLDKGNFTNQGSIEERKEAYIMASNPLPKFLKSCCDFADEHYVKNAELYVAYTQFLKTNKRRGISKKEFSQLLSEEGFFVEKSNKNIGQNYVNSFFIDGIKLKENWKLLIHEKNSTNSTNSTGSPLSSTYGKKKYRTNTKSTICTISPEITPEDVIFHIEILGKGEMPIEQCLEDLSIDEKFLAQMLEKGQLFQHRAGWVKVL